MFIFSLDLNIPSSKKEEFEKILQEKHSYFYKDYLYEEDNILSVHLINELSNPALENESEDIQDFERTKEIINFLTQVKNLNAFIYSSEVHISYEDSETLEKILQEFPQFVFDNWDDCFFTTFDIYTTFHVDESKSSEDESIEKFIQLFSQINNLKSSSHD